MSKVGHKILKASVLKKHTALILFAAALIILIFQSFFSSGFPYTHDGENHLARFANYFIALKEGQLPPRFAPNLHNKYGYPVFNYNYPLPNILSVPFSVVGTHYELTFKLLVFASLLFGGIGLYRFIQATTTKLDTTAIIVVFLTYIANPYVINVVLYRGSIGELLAYSLMPWVLSVVELSRSTHSRTRIRLLVEVLILTAFLLSHNVSVLFGSLFIALYSILRFGTEMSFYRKLVAPTVIALLCSLWFWMPAVLEMDYVSVAETDLQYEYMLHFPKISELVFSPLQFGFSQPGSSDSLSFWLHPIALVGVITGVLMLAVRAQKNRKKSFRNVVPTSPWGAAVLLSIMALIFQLSISEPVWGSIPFARFIQFPWRLALFFSVFSSIAIYYAYTLSINSVKIFVWIITIGYLAYVLTLTPVDRFSRRNIDYEHFTQTTTTKHENMPNTFTYDQIGDWQPAPVLDPDSGQATIHKWRGSYRSYGLSLDSKTLVIEPTMNFPGWQTRVGGELVEYVDSKVIAGRIAYSLPAGEYEIQTSFTQWTWPRIVGNGLSALSLLGVVLFAFLPRY